MLNYKYYCTCKYYSVFSLRVEFHVTHMQTKFCQTCRHYIED